MLVKSLLSASLISVAVAGPRRNVKRQEPNPRINLPLGTAVGGALDLPTTVTHAPLPTNFNVKAAAQTDLLTITVVNSHGNDVSTIFTGPTPVAGNAAPGRLANGESGSVVVPAGWQGNIAVNDAQFSAGTGDESLIESSFVDQGAGFAQGDVNISFVNGFSAAIVCWCNENNIMTGCNKNLFEMSQCPDNNGQNSCRNPLRPDLSATQPTDFFRPCFGQGGAYTFPMDSSANNLNAKCPSEDYTCCVGAACPANPNF